MFLLLISTKLARVFYLNVFSLMDCTKSRCFFLAVYSAMEVRGGRRNFNL